MYYNFHDEEEVKEVKKDNTKNTNNKTKYLIICISFILVIILVIFLFGYFMKKKNNVKVDYPTNLPENTPYTERIFDTNYMHEINIIIDKKDWKDLTENPLNKTKYKVDVLIDGIKFNNVSFNTKGNSSLNNVANAPQNGPASNRYSFKINFGKYEKDQTYYGLDKLNLNNNYGDASYLNDYIAYNTFRAAGIPAPLCSFAYIKINGESFGLYTIVEEVEDSFLKRNNLTGNLYKPEQTDGQDRGASLTYTDDNIESYIDIFNNVQTKSSDEDYKRLIDIIKKLNNLEDLDNILDTDTIIRYFAAHNFLLSYDSYTGKSIHNYFLLESNNKISILPWDYNLSFGRYNMHEDITTIINYGIDSPLYNINNESRPLWNWILSKQEYIDKYHEVMNELLYNYYESGLYEKDIDNIYKLIKPYIEKDYSAFYKPEEVDRAVTTLKDFIKNRIQSIRLQLDNKLSTITEEQDKELKVNSSNINLEDLGLVADDKKRK